MKLKFSNAQAQSVAGNLCSSFPGLYLLFQTEIDKAAAWYSSNFFSELQICFSLNKVNNNTNLLPNITLGMEIRDDCGTVNTALEQCLNFVLGTLTNKEQICSSRQASDAVKKKAALVGVVGPSYSTTTIQVNVNIS